MRLSKTKVGVFFLAVLILGWFLYPQELFLGFIYEGQTALARSEAYYLDYLKKKPGNRFGTLRLAHLYERMGEPEKATPLLKNLYDHRLKDWKLAREYLSHLENRKDEEALFRARLEVAKNFMKETLFPKGRVVELLDSAMQHAVWKQRTDEVYAILYEILKISRRPENYLYFEQDLDRALKKTEKVVAFLQKELKQNPKEEDIRMDLSSLYLQSGQKEEAQKVLSEGLRLLPQSLPLLKTRADLYEKLGEIQKAIADVQTVLKQKELDPEERREAIRMLAPLYVKNQEIEKALSLYETLLKEDKGDQDIWFSLLFVLDRLQRPEELVDRLKEYLTHFPDDKEQEKLLVETHLYRLKEVTALPLYLAWLQKTKDPDFALGVADLLQKEKEWASLKQWLETAVTLFPSREIFLGMRIDLAIEEKELEEGLKFCLALEKGRPADPHLILQIAQLYELLGEPQASKDYYSRLSRLPIEETSTLISIGREILFSANPSRVFPYLEKAIQRSPSNPEAWFLYEEALISQGKKTQGLLAARKVVSLLEPKLKRVAPGRVEEEDRLLLKSKGRIDFSEAIQRDYQRRKKQSNLDFQTDHLDLLIENKRMEVAGRELSELRRVFPKEARRLRFYEVRLALEEKRWDRAVLLLKEILAEQPTLWSARRDLAEALENSGEWREAIQEYEKLQGTGGDTLKILEPLKALRAKYDDRVTTLYRLTDYGAESFMEWGARFKKFVAKDWEFWGEMVSGIFKSPSNNFEETIAYGKWTLNRHFFPNWNVGAGLGFGTSPSRTTPSLFLQTGYQIPGRLEVELSLDVRTLRTDLPQGVAHGVLSDRNRLEGQVFLTDRLNLTGRYEFKRNVLPDGATAYEQLVEPLVDYILVKKPEFRLGYQFTFTKIFDSGGFIDRVPLIRRIRAHYLAGSFYQSLSRDFFLEVGGFIGEDTVRNLHFTEVDLWGARGGIQWNINPWLDLEGNYAFGRETLVGLAGDSHHLEAGLSGHW